MFTILQDLKYACRTLMKSPGFAIVAIATLAIGIGLNTAMFSVVHTVLMRPLPFQNPERIVAIHDAYPPMNVLGGAVSPPNFLDWQAQNHSLSAMAAYTEDHLTLTGSGNPRQIEVVFGTPQIFDVLKSRPTLGRGFIQEEGERGRDHVVVLSHSLWEQAFGGDAGVVGKTIELDGEKYYIIGVMPRNFQFPLSGTEAWLPLSFPATVSTQRGAHWLSVIGRLKDGVSLEQAQSDLKSIAAVLEKQYPRTNEGSSVAVSNYRDSLVGKVRTSLLVLLGAVAFVVLIACVNVANLLLARSAARERELAIRAALGASRGRLIRQLLTESVLLSAAGAAAGVVLAAWLQGAIVQFGPKGVPLLEHLGLNSQVLLFTGALVIITTLLFGLLPAMRAAGSDLHAAMRSGAMGAIGGKHHRSVRNSLVVAELALSMLLLVGAGLLIRSFQRLSGVDPGFQADNVLSFNIGLPEARYKDTPQINLIFDDLLSRIRALPGVQSAGLSNMLPLSGSRFSGSMYIDNAADDPLSAQVRVAGAGYFETMQIPLLRGRLIGSQDQPGAQKVLLISESGAKKVFPGIDPIGHHVRFGARPGKERLEGDIVGIVGDVHDFSLAMAPPPMFYAATPQSGVSFSYVVVRTQGEPEALVHTISEQLRAIDPNLPMADVKPLSALLTSSLAERRFYMFLLGLFAAVALLLSVVGIYGVISYSVTQRTREIGVRVALGARQADILRMVVGEAVAMVMIGVAIGVIGAALLTQFLKSLLFEVGSHDPATMAAVSVVLVTFALFASYWPARRAMQVDPMIALRSE